MPDSKSRELPLTRLWQSLSSPGIEAYQAAGGYGAALETARKGGREVISLLRDADVRARDAQGEPLYLSWRTAQATPAEVKYVLCAAVDPDPEASIYRELILRSPHLVIEGMICGALAVGAEEGYLYLPEGDHKLYNLLDGALHQAHAQGLLGEDALLELRLVTGRQSFMCGLGRAASSHLEVLLQEEAPLRRGFTQGLFGWPSLFHDPETWAQAALALKGGADWYRRLGKGLAGTKLIHLSGPVANPGLYEVPLGQPLIEIIKEAGGLKEGKALKALQLGGAVGGYLPGRLLDLPLDYEVLAEVGVSLGSGGLQVLDDTVCLVARTLELASRCLDSPCAEESDCQRRLNRVNRLLGEVELSQARASHLENLEQMAVQLLGLEAQGGQGAIARPLITSLSYFESDYLHHIEQHCCAVGSRRGLTTAPCQAVCPAGVDVPTYAAYVAQGRYEDAVRVIRQDNPLASVCGTVCTHPCEAVCTRGEMDEPISIMHLKGFAASRVLEDGGYPRPEMAPPRRERVAVVGSGPAGLSAAYFLALKGYQVTIFEALPVAGGILSVGIPEYRLPTRVVQAEVRAITDLGVELKLGVRVGRDVGLDELREEGYQAFFLGVGAHEGMHLDIDGERELAPVFDSLTFLRQVRMGRKKAPAAKVVVVGGGNAAIDAARTCVRMGCEEVQIAYRRTRREMPAWEAEIREAEEEGVKLNYLTIPKRIIGEGGRVTGLECLKAELGEPDASGRRRPVPKPGSDFVLQAGAIITAIGQRPDMTCLTDKADLTVSNRGLLVVGPHDLQTSAARIFGGGDAATGPATIVQAVAAGKQAAESIHASLNGIPLPQGPLEKKPRERLEPMEQGAEERTSTHRARMPLIPLEDRLATFKRVERGLSEAEAQREASRCLRCDLCVGCGLCQRVCEEMGVSGLQLTTTTEGRLALTDFHRPARSCIGCGSCVQVCPHRNIRMVDQGEERRIVFCGTETARLTLQACESCGKTIAPEAYIAFLRRLVSEEAFDKQPRKLCPDCSRTAWAKGQVGDALWFPPS